MSAEFTPSLIARPFVGMTVLLDTNILTDPAVSSEITMVPPSDCSQAPRG